ncbi:TraR/DksA C4-type zinc finger protein [Alicyclobacillus dauci]|uniref:TraR/DksA C4-type zinc finger protein n=1 Tax=Alicyclobacillus dauci TaxID=1475485 RepID=A0ABY6Z441_9BACL|nr:TraR/DksA C4-type zinc finger protein [Alicyclobacillus dauci]WAH37086.1 TraR/DksA C4-type zinc finger protein [Alicyclobacillus dauci]
MIDINASGRVVSDVNYEELRAVLEKQKEDVLERLKNAEGDRLEESMRDQFSELSMYDNHPADLGSEIFLRSQDVGQRIRDEAHLEDIELALRAFDKGTYGTCEDCGRDIGLERLTAMPTARLCIDCQARDEEIVKLRNRPKEEEVLSPGFGQYNYDGIRDEYTGYDAEDAYQDVARYNIGTGNVDINDDLDEDDLDDDEGLVDVMDGISNEEYKDQLPPSPTYRPTPI